MNMQYLSELEKEIACLLLEGHKSAEIARRLNRTINAVKAAYWRIRMNMHWRSLSPCEVENGSFFQSEDFRKAKNLSDFS